MKEHTEPNNCSVNCTVNIYTGIFV